MAIIDHLHVADLFHRGATATTTKEKGDALEKAICYVFSRVPGMLIKKTNRRNAFDTEEIDIAFFNDREPTGLPFVPWIVLVECKNWQLPVGSESISWFDRKISDRGLEFGILVAANGITGEPGKLTDAHFIIAGALSKGRRIIVITRDEILKLRDSADLVLMIKEKLCELVVAGTITS